MNTTLDAVRSRVTDAGWLNERLSDFGVWPDGAAASVRAERIGADFGFSAVVDRLHLRTLDGRSTTLVAKIEAASLIRTAIAVREQIEQPLAGAIPACFGWSLDAATSGHQVEVQEVDGQEPFGVLLMEDVTPAVQGDELRPITASLADAVVHVVKRLHELTVPDDTSLDRWHPSPPQPERWASRLEVIQQRHADRFTRRRWLTIESLDERAHASAAALSQTTSSLIHRDPHLDNVLFRPDGSVVLLDWSNARVGPPALDIAVLLFSTCFNAEPCRTPEEIVDVYERAGASLDDADQFHAAVRHAVAVHARGVAGWVGQPPTSPMVERIERLRDDAVGRVVRALDWLDLTV